MHLPAHIPNMVDCGPLFPLVVQVHQDPIELLPVESVVEGSHRSPNSTIGMQVRALGILKTARQWVAQSMSGQGIDSYAGQAVVCALDSQLDVGVEPSNGPPKRRQLQAVIIVDHQ